MVFRASSFIFCLETTVKEVNWIRTTSVTVMVIFFFKNVILCKVLSQGLRGALTTDLKDTLQLNILRT